MLAENVIVPDPVNYAALTAWNNAVAAARAQVALHTANAASIAASLRLDLPTSPASVAQANLGATASALATANSALATAQQEQTRAQNDARTADAAVLAAQAAEAAATKRVSDALAARMASATTSAALSATVDGLALRERYRVGGGATPPVWDLATIPFRATAAEVPLDPQVSLPVVGDADHRAVLKVLDDLDDSVDAIADLVAAEGIHQLVGGNLARPGRPSRSPSPEPCPMTSTWCRRRCGDTTSPTGYWSWGTPWQLLRGPRPRRASSAPSTPGMPPGSPDCCLIHVSCTCRPSPLTTRALSSPRSTSPLLSSASTPLTGCAWRPTPGSSRRVWLGRPGR